MIFSDYTTKNAMSPRGVGHVIFSLHLGVGGSVLCQMEGVGHVFFNHHILKCSGPSPPPVLFDQSLSCNMSISGLNNLTTER